MPKRCLIRVDGATATLSRIPTPAAYLAECLSFLHPGRFFNKGFRAGYWDGRVCLANGNEFPSGFVQRVREHLATHGIRAKVKARGAAPVDDSRLDADFLHGIKLWDHQLAAVRAMLANRSGWCKEPTGSGKTAMMAAAARLFWEERGWPSLIVVPRKGLAGQTRKALRRFYNDEIRVGIAGDGHRKGGAVVVATAQTLAHFQSRLVHKRGRKKPVRVEGDEWLADLIEQTKVIFFDECHRTKSTQWQEISAACPAVRRYGLSGTPLSENEFNDVKLEGATGQRIHSTKASEMIRKGLAAKPKIVMIESPNAAAPSTLIPSMTKGGKVTMREPEYRKVYEKAIVKSRRHNDAVIAAIRWLFDRKRRILTLCRLKAHFVKLAERLEEAGIDSACLWGDTHTEERDEAKQMFADGTIRSILATTIFDEGEDVGGIDAIVLAEGVKVNTSALQRIGRGMRRDSKDVWVVDFVPVGSPVLTKHANERRKIYEAEGYEVRTVTEWPRRVGDRVPKNLLPFQTWDRETGE